MDLARQRVFFYDNAAAREQIATEQVQRHRAELRGRYIDLWTRTGAGSGERFYRDYVNLAAEMVAGGIEVPPEPTDSIKRFTWICLSAAAGTGVGFDYDSLLQVANYALKNCPELVHYFLAVARRADTTKILLSQDDTAHAKRWRPGKERIQWRDRIPQFRESYQLALQQQKGEYRIERCFASLYDLLFPVGWAPARSQ